MTTAEVRDLPEMTLELYQRALADGLADAGWPASWAPEMGRELAAFAADWDAGTVLERDLDTFTERLIGTSPQM
jgi:hypothetical protein